MLSRAQRYGKTVFISRDSAIGGECEREMELELEEEEEVEREVEKMPPREETDWDYAAALAVNSPNQLSTTVKVGNNRPQFATDVQQHPSLCHPCALCLDPAHHSFYDFSGFKSTDAMNPVQTAV